MQTIAIFTALMTCIVITAVLVPSICYLENLEKSEFDIVQGKVREIVVCLWFVSYLSTVK